MGHVGSAFWRGMRIVGIAILGILSATCFGLLFGLIIRALWNWLMPAVFGLPMINYWQAFGLILLTRLLVGTIGFRGEAGKGGHLHERWDDDEEWKWTCKWDRDCWRYYDEWWRTEGKAAYARYVESKKTSANTVDE
ncbi:MAG TPA: hypothetical protein VIL66_05415 [Bacillota bacterium]